MGLLDRLLTFGDEPPAPAGPVLIEAGEAPAEPRFADRVTQFASRVLQGAPGDGDGEKAGSKPTEKDREWQARAWEYSRQVGEIHYARDFVGSCFSRLALTLGVMTKTGVVVPAFDDEGNPLDGGGGVIDQALEILAALKGPIGGQRMLQRQCGEGLFVAGEMFLVGVDVPQAGTPDDQGDAGKWVLNSTSEIKIKGDKNAPKYERRSPGALKGEELPADAMVSRIWKPDAEYNEQADSSVRGILDVAGELVWLTRLIKGTTRSRLVGAGVYWVANEIDYQPAPGGEPLPEGVDPFTHDFVKATSDPLTNPDSATSAVPFVVRAPHEFIKDGIRLDEFGKGLADFPAIELRREAVVRAAQGLSLPMEVITGQGSANHWSAFQIDASLFRAHIEPLAEVMVDGFTGGYLHPMMKAAGLELRVEITLPNGSKVEGVLVVTYDPSELISYPNRSADADSAHDRLEISGTAYRRAKGWTESDKPDDEEVEERLRRAQVLKGRGAGTPDGGEGGDGGGEPSGTDQAAVEPQAMAALAMRIADAADPFVKRVVERVGAKLVSACETAKQRDSNGLKDAIRGVSNRDVAAALGPKRVTDLINVDRMLASEFGPLVGSARTFAEESGHPDVDPVAVATAVGDRCVELAKVRMFQPARPVSASDFLDVLAPELVPQRV